MESRTLNQQVADAKLADQVLHQRLETAKQDLILARIKRPLDERKVKERENMIQDLMSEIEKVKELNEDLAQQKVIARKQEKNIELLIHEQKEVIAKLKTESRALLQQLKSAQAINARILELSGQAISMERETSKKIDRSATSSGFHSLQTILEILESEVSGSGRKMYHWTNQFLV